MLIGIEEIKYKLRKIKQGYNALKENYDDLLDPTDKIEIFKNDQIWVANISEVNKIKRYILCIWIFLLVAYCVAIEYISSSPIIYPTLRELFK